MSDWNNFSDSESYLQIEITYFILSCINWEYKIPIQNQFKSKEKCLV